MNSGFHHYLVLLEITLLVRLLGFHTLRFLNCLFGGGAWCSFIYGWSWHVRHIERLSDTLCLWWASFLLIRLQRLEFLVQLLIQFVLAAISHTLKLLLLAHLIRLSTIVGTQVVFVLVKLIESHRNVGRRLVWVALQGHRVLALHLVCVGLSLGVWLRLLFYCWWLLYRIFLLWLIVLRMFLYYILFYFCVLNGCSSLFLTLRCDVWIVDAFRRLGRLMTIIFVAKAQINHIGLALVLFARTRGSAIFSLTSFSHAFTFLF